MAEIKIEATLKYDEDLMNGGDTDADAKAWFFDEVLKGGRLCLMDFGDLGDEVGEITIHKMDA